MTTSTPVNSSAIFEEICIDEPDPRWPEAFVFERNRLLDLFPNQFSIIEHFGSTAVPGLAAKPIIDLMAGVASLCQADTLLSSLCANGYETSAAYNANLPDSRWLMRQAFGRRTHHLHLVVSGSPKWVRCLQFRDMLLTDTGIAGRYQDLKRELAEKYRNDREAYTHGKSAFIDAVLLAEIRRKELAEAG